MSRLIPDSTVGRRWAKVASLAGRYRRDPAGDPFALLRIENCNPPGESVNGPLIYLALGQQEAQWVGQSRTTLAERFRIHLREPVKRCTWSHVAFLQLRDDAPALVIDDLEYQAATILRPQMGQRKPRRRLI